MAFYLPSPIMFSALCKLRQLWQHINKNSQNKIRCVMNHRTEYQECAVEVIYQIPFQYGKAYIGQNGTCTNERTREHDFLLKSASVGHLPSHVADCRCRPNFNNIQITGRGNVQPAREFLEAFEIIKAGAYGCVILTSVYLHSK